MSFIYDKKETYSQEELDKILEQNSNYVVKTRSDELKRIADEEAKKGMDKELSREKYISSLPESKRAYANKLLDKGVSADDLAEMGDLFKEDKQPVVDISQLLGEADEKKRIQAENERKESLQSKAKSGNLSDKEMEEYMLSFKNK